MRYEYARKLSWFLFCSLFVIGLSCQQSPVHEESTMLRISRTIHKEPAYNTQPLYALLVFGERADEKHWLVVDDKVAYFDTDGNLDLTDANDRYVVDATSEDPTFNARSFKIAKIGGIRGRNLRIDIFFLRSAPLGLKTPVQSEVIGDSSQKQIQTHAASIILTTDSGDEIAPTTLGISPASAPVLNFCGPLTFGTIGDFNYLYFARQEPSKIAIGIGHAGIGKQSFVFLSYSHFPPDARPEALIEFPSLGADKPIKIKLRLDDKC